MTSLCFQAISLVVCSQVIVAVFLRSPRHDVRVYRTAASDVIHTSHLLLRDIEMSFLPLPFERAQPNHPHISLFFFFLLDGLAQSFFSRPSSSQLVFDTAKAPFTKFSAGLIVGGGVFAGIGIVVGAITHQNYKHGEPLAPHEGFVKCLGGLVNRSHAVARRRSRRAPSALLGR